MACSVFNDSGSLASLPRSVPPVIPTGRLNNSGWKRSKPKSLTTLVKNDAINI